MSVEGIDATEAALVAAMLEADNVPDANQAAKCFSCDADMKGLFCSECGQKNDNYRRSIFSLVADLIGSIFSLESRIWATWATLLFKPGKVPREFSDGKRSKWSSPIRVYLAVSIILFGFMSITNTHLVSMDLNAQIKDGIDKPFEELTSGDINTKWKAHFFERQKDIDSRNETRDFRLIELWFEGAGDGKVEKGVAEIVADVQAANDLEAIPNIGIGVEDAEEGEDDGLQYIIINGRRLDGKEGGQFVMNFMKNPIMVTRSFNTWLPRLMFIMMPFTMLLGALFIRDKKRALLFDHLVHATYIHAVAFFLLLMGILLSKVIGGTTVFQAIFVALLIYLPISLKRMFGRGWFKTILASYSVGFLYLLILMGALTGLISSDIASEMGGAQINL